LRILVLGGAAGGGVPQWNCNAPISSGVREGRIESPCRTQASIAVSLDGERWVLLNASPDLRQQLLQQHQLWPRPGRLRDSPVQAVLLTGGEIDNVAGLLTMRERQAFSLWATRQVLAMLCDNPVFEALDRNLVQRCPLPLDRSVTITGPEGELGIGVLAFPVPGKVPLYLEKQAGSDLTGSAEGSIGLEISAGGKTFHYIPGCAGLTPGIRARINRSDLLFFDGTLWSDDEMIVAGTGEKTGRRMGHMSMSGPEGSITLLDDLELGRRMFIHVNNSNPVLLADSPQRAEVNRAGWEVAADGMEIDL
jgi:pyrroloquinoline quinone biosynthesis protein B